MLSSAHPSPIKPHIKKVWFLLDESVEWRTQNTRNPLNCMGLQYTAGELRLWVALSQSPPKKCLSPHSAWAFFWRISPKTRPPPNPCARTRSQWQRALPGSKRHFNFYRCEYKAAAKKIPQLLGKCGPPRLSDTGWDLAEGGFWRGAQRLKSTKIVDT